MIENLIRFFINGLISGCILAVPTMGFTLIFLVLRFPSFAVAGHMAVGAFAGYGANVALGFPPSLSFVVAFLVAGVSGVATDYVAIRPFRARGQLTLAIISISLNIMIESVLQFFFGGTPRDFDIPVVRDWIVGPVRIGPEALETMLLAMLIMAAAIAVMKFTSIGKSMRAVADNPGLAEVKGIDPERMSRIANFFGMGLAGGGGMLVAVNSVVAPGIGSQVLISVFAAAVLGGVGSIPGSVFGALLIGVAEECSLIVLPATYRSAVGFLVILLVLFLRPRGLAGAGTA